MVAIKIGKHITAVLERGREEARAEGAGTVEAAHLLLALAAGENAAACRALAGAGLDHEAVRAALRREFEHSLRAVGVTDLTRQLPPPSPAPRRPAQIGASAKLAIERGVRAAARAEFLPAHLLVGIVRAEAGTVPRALRLAGIDPADIERRVAAELGAEPAR
ncbi:Clp protease N-terminal domain-containing protein [Nocardia aurantia]|uniref:Clp R domain-containing protein n=1 Tax=Nocardia aurantia TaxID=2585199 RepID=A0A7K0DSL8_9NOCA|nr:Clp protease N-terminal domain-containing protein [Nocardia aurantia]MQY28759.1 hypothetical protein [Nocardia aurantia]